MSHSLSNVRVKANEPLHDILQQLQLNDHGICVVTDEADQILGTITDGDCRRALLKNKGDLTTSAEQVMNTKFIVVDESFSQDQIFSLMRTNAIQQIPVISGENTLVDVVSSRSIQRTIRPNKALILAGGRGSRLMPLTKTLPKPMLHVSDKPMLHQLVHNLVEYGFTDVVLSVNYLSHIIEDYFQDGKNFGCNISYLREEKELGTAGPLTLIDSFNDEPILLMNGDLVTSVDFGALIDFHAKNSFDISVAVSLYKVQIPYGVLEVTSDHLISGVTEKPKLHYPVNAGVYVINPETAAIVPKDTFFPMTDLINLALEHQKSVGAFAMHESWEDVGIPEQYFDALKRSQKEKDIVES